MGRFTCIMSSISPWLRGFILTQATLVPALAQASDAKDEFEHAVSSQMAATVKQDVEAFFRQLHLTKPESVETEAVSEVDTSSGTPQVTKLKLHVKVVTDQPSQVIREARHRLVRLLREQGYRFDTSEGGPTNTRPLATLTIESINPPPAYNETAQTWVYAGFAGLMVALCTSLATLLYIIFLPWIRWRRARAFSKDHSAITPQSEPEVDALPPFSENLGRTHESAQSQPVFPAELPPLPFASEKVPPSETKSQGRTSTIEVGGWSTLTQVD